MPRTLSRIKIAPLQQPAWYTAMQPWSFAALPNSAETAMDPAAADKSGTLYPYSGAYYVDAVNIGGTMTPGGWYTNAGGGGHACGIAGNQGGVYAYGPLSSETPSWVMLRAPYLRGAAAASWWAANREPTYSSPVMANPTWGDGSWIGMHSMDLQKFCRTRKKLYRAAVADSGYPPGPGATTIAWWVGALDFASNTYANAANALTQANNDYPDYSGLTFGPTFLDSARGKMFFCSQRRWYSMNLDTLAVQLETTLPGAQMYSEDIVCATNCSTGYDPASGILFAHKYQQGGVTGFNAYWFDVTNLQAANPITFSGDTRPASVSGGGSWMAYAAAYAWGSYWLFNVNCQLFRVTKPAVLTNPWPIQQVALANAHPDGYSAASPIYHANFYAKLIPVDSPKGFLIGHFNYTGSRLAFLKVP